MSTTPSTLFTGTSRYSSDFQSVIQRAVNIASLPLNQYKNEQSALNAQATALTSLSGNFSSLQSALDSLTNAASAANKRADSSDTSVLTADVTADATPGTYTFDITNPGAAATSLSSSAGLLKVTDPAKSSITDKGSFTLTVTTDPGTPQQSVRTFSFSAATSLNALRDQINVQAGANVQATIVNVGTADAPDYRVSLQSTKLVPEHIQLNDGSKDLMSFQTPGARVAYKLNGSTEVFLSDSRSLALSPGLTVHVQAATSGTPVTLTVSSDDTQLSSALSSFATAYNSVVDELDKNRGQGGGALTGNSIISSLSSTLQNLTFYYGDGNSLATIGLVLGKDGHLSLDQDTFDAAMKDPSSVAQFLGSATSGYLSTAKSMLDSVTGTSGTLTSASQLVQDDLVQQQQLIDDNQARVDQLQEQLQEQMAAADALIAQMEQQATFMTNMFQAMTTDSKNQ
jgi:flagellar hook-associated protein 2